jgi:DNA-binding XRE family transcriptional regulator
MTSMDELGRQLISAVVFPEFDEPTDPVDLVHELRQEYGSLSEAARQIGVDRRTLQRWEATRGGRRTSPNSDTVIKVRAAVRKLIQQKPHGPTDTNITLVTTDKDAPRRQPRHISGRQLQLQPGTMAHIDDAFRKGADPATIGKIFVSRVQTQFYRNYLGASDPDSDYADSDYGAGSINILTA